MLLSTMTMICTTFRLDTFQQRDLLCVMKSPYTRSWLGSYQDDAMWRKNSLFERTLRIYVVSCTIDDVVHQSHHYNNAV
jgi:hypothetical protein